MFPDLHPIVPLPPEPVEKISAGRRLTIRQKTDIANHIHPLTRGHLREPIGETCGTCAHRAPASYGDYPKCVGYNGRFISRGPATDCRAWWPACAGWVAKP